MFSLDIATKATQGLGPFRFAQRKTSSRELPKGGTQMLVAFLLICTLPRRLNARMSHALLKNLAPSQDTVPTGSWSAKAGIWSMGRRIR